MDNEELKTLILTCDVPLVFKDVIKSELEQWDLTKWKELFKDQKLTFRCGKNSYNKEPQWETSTKTIKGTFQDFLKHTDVDSEKWWYFDYKYLRNLHYMEKVEKNITWTKLGFHDVSSKDGVIWIGSKGAHTCCHKDTYGCNLIYQIYGRKQWLLFPPEENLRPTRIPYEESSIYSRLNFFSPNPEDFSDFGNCYKIILNPGDVLLVPNKWWHYVENLETSISVNNWIGLPQDSPEHVKEAIAQLLFSRMTSGLNREEKKIVLNPNMTSMLNCQSLLNVINAHIDDPSYANSEIPVNTQATLAKYIKYVTKVPKLAVEEFQQLIRNQRNRFDSVDVKNKENSTDDSNAESGITMADILDAFAEDDVLTLISKKLLKAARNKVVNKRHSGELS